MMKLKKNQLKKNTKKAMSQPGLIHQTHNSGHGTEITS